MVWYLGWRVGDVWLNPAFRESRALQDVHFLLLGHLFGLGYRRVERKVDAVDTDSRTELPAAGFHLEGVLRKHMIVKVCVCWIRRWWHGDEGWFLGAGGGAVLCVCFFFLMLVSNVCVCP